MRDDSGAAVVEFLLVSIVLIALLMGVVQVGLYLHVRNVVAASAAEGARFAANYREQATAGGPVAHNIIAGALSARVANGITCTGSDQAGDGGVALVAVRCTGTVPLVFSWLGSIPGLNVSAHAMKETG